MSQTLAITIYRPTVPLKGAVEIIHGMQEHRKRYEEFAEYLLESRMDAIDVDKGFEKICGNRCNWCFCRDVKGNSFHVGRGCPCYAEAVLYSLNSK